MGKLSAALGLDAEMGESLGGEDVMEDAPMSEKPEAASAETLAMKQFKRAATPEAMAQAMKDFLEACGLY